MSQPSQPNHPARPSSPFSSSPSRLPGTPSATPSPGSRFGGASATPGAATPATPAPAPRPNPLTNRLPTRMDWRVMSVSPTYVRFDLDGLGDPFYRLLGKRLVVDFGDPAAVSKAMEAGGQDVQEIAARLNTAWEDFNLGGAILLYRWTKDIRQVLIGRIPVDEDEFEDEDAQPAVYDDDKRKPPTILRAMDMLLVMNVLGRVRSNILLKSAPLALEAEYLSATFITDDPRLVTLAQATGCVEEAVLK